MASLCKRQQCTVERRGFRQELDSWRHKLIHCVGFESILEGLFGPGLVSNTLFQDCEPEEVSDWTVDDNCLFCCLRREKVKDSVLSESSRSRLERQAQDFLNAVFHRKDLPSFSEPHIPLVAREIMQRMIRQFAAEYTSKTTTQDSPPPPPPPLNGAMKDQSLTAIAPPSSPGPAPASPPSSASSSPSPPTPGPGLSPAPNANATANANGAPALNPVLSKLLMADQEAPLDLSVKKSEGAEPEDGPQQDGVLDLSTKKNNNLKTFTGVKGPSIKAERGSVDLDEEVLLPRNLQDGRREDGRRDDGRRDDGRREDGRREDGRREDGRREDGRREDGRREDGRRDGVPHAASFKPPLARSLRIKEELLSQKHRLLGQPAALSLASLESAGLLGHAQSYPVLGGKSSSSFWGSKAHLESLMKLKQASGELKDLPAFLENHHSPHHHGGFFKSSLHHHQLSKTHPHHEARRDQGHSPPVDLKIPQVRGMDLSWDSHASELYGYGAMGGVGGGHVENSLSRKLRAILPKQNRRGGSLGSLLDGAADYWSSELEHGGSGPAYSTSDAEGGDPNSKQPRKKRGRYRQYNTEILEEAITVVMSGKMSVSKAQNMYGIPHSTLEYKVKERMGTLKNPPKKKLKLMMKMEAGGQDFPLLGESENTPTSAATPRDDGVAPPPELQDEVKEEELDLGFKPLD